MVRKPAVAGAFYPSSPANLQAVIQDFLNRAPKTELPGNLKAIISPHAGYVYSGSTAAYGYKLIPKSTKRIVLIGPGHYAAANRPAFSSEDYFETPLGQVKLFMPFENATFNDEAHLQEHSLEVQIPFLQTVLDDFELLPIILNNCDESENLAKMIKPLLDSETILVTSSDLSHFHQLEEAKKIDNNANKYIPELNTEKTKEKVEACGLAGIITTMHLAKAVNWRGYFLKYQTSASVSDDTSQVVGYGSYAFTEK